MPTGAPFGIWPAGCTILLAPNTLELEPACAVLPLCHTGACCSLRHTGACCSLRCTHRSQLSVHPTLATCPNLPCREGHGTQVAGILAAKTNNSIGVAGLAYQARPRQGLPALEWVAGCAFLP